jgi:hypothetical protein
MHQINRNPGIRGSALPSVGSYPEEPMVANESGLRLTAE